MGKWRSAQTIGHLAAIKTEPTFPYIQNQEKVIINQCYTGSSPNCYRTQKQSSQNTNR